MKKNAKGFSLLELIIVISIIGILAITTLPQIKSYSSVKLTGAANKLASDIVYTQQLAISRQKRYGIFFNTSDHQYFVYGYNDPVSINFSDTNNFTVVEDPHTRGPMIMDFQTHSAYQDIEIFNINYQGHRLEFDQWGVPYGGDNQPLKSTGYVVFYLSGKLIEIDVSPQTGKVSIKKEVK